MTAKINKDFWNFILKEIRIGLNIDEIYVIETKFLDDPSIAYYYRTENAYFTLYNKFKIELNINKFIFLTKDELFK